jgi:hypothetical protein
MAVEEYLRSRTPIGDSLILSVAHKISPDFVDEDSVKGTVESKYGQQVEIESVRRALAIGYDPVQNGGGWRRK